MTTTRRDAHGKWRSILTQFGFTPKQLSGTHQECPMCGGTDRWRLSDHDGHGSYYCSGCGPGSGFDLLMKAKGWDFKTTAEEVDKLVSAGTLTNAPDTFTPENEGEKRRKNLNRLWKGSVPLPAKGAGTYISSRGLMPLLNARPALFADVRFHPGIYLQNLSRTVPGMVALIRDKRGAPISIHRTYFDPKCRKVMPPVAKLTGGGIRLGDLSGDCLVVGEGIETTLSGCEYYECDGLATISANLMETVAIPKHINKVIILADNDLSFTGQKAAFTLARRLDNDGKVVLVVMSMMKGEDYNDVARGVGGTVLEMDNG